MKFLQYARMYVCACIRLYMRLAIRLSFAAIRLSCNINRDCQIYTNAKTISFMFLWLSPQVTVTSVWKTSVCKWGVCKRGVLKCAVSYVLNFRGWIKLIYDKITLIYSVKNAFNPASEVQNIENGVFQNAPFANGSFLNGDKSCLWA